MSLSCEISGESLLGVGDEVVVTPSGHVCIKRLLLEKLAENGGLDPFETTTTTTTNGGDIPLSQDQLVTLRATATAGNNNNNNPRATTGIPPRPRATSIPGMLGVIQKEYDALVLELFDTRKALEETRRELSQALYQNDAAIRVVARVAQERDAARQQLEQWSASTNANAVGAAAVDSAAAQEPTVAAPPSSEEPPSAKRRRIIEPTAAVLENDLPEDDLRAMSDVWAQLNKVRKPTLKAAAASAPSPQSLAACKFLGTKAWHKSTNRGILGIASGGNNNDHSNSNNNNNDHNLTVTVGRDKQIVVYNEVDKVVQHTFALGSVPTSVDIGKTVIVVGSNEGVIALFPLGGDRKGNGNANGHPNAGEIIDVSATVIDVRVHPTEQHICAATADGRLIVAYWLAEEQRLQPIATFRSQLADDDDGYTAACLHPDGLIYVAGTRSGKIHVWDFKNKVLAATLQDGDGSDGVTAIAFSNNGYHIAVGHDSATVRFWDLRKQKVAASINCAEGEPSLKSVRSVVFDKAGKYAAMGGEGGVKITTVKEWGVTGSFETKHPVSGMVWSSGSGNSSSLLEVSCDGERAVQLYGVPSSDA
eukprot:CAMPEP_0172381010 /NCGR_PEP_ID=MMETSP1060-20121228/70732_1 /TAXON_ID=37318 /ORGANISM="Pseudo-nitzschia pungens, Strain cf. cingulata" /LENGTH=590 /DNA_ID=CAMNT_0013108777 /DNA_START=282 /DNA_END=2054 /DNA_ORIENTATION=+